MALRNAFGGLALQETLAQIGVYASRIASSLGFMSYDTSGRLRVILADNASPISNMGAAGGYNMQYDQYGQMMQGAMNLRARINVS